MKWVRKFGDLLDNGANIDTYLVTIGQTMLIHAVSSIFEGDSTERYQLVLFLLSRGANVNVTGSFGWTVLHYATHNGYYDILPIFINLGMDINVTNNNGCTPIESAIYQMTSEHVFKAISVLIEEGANLPNRNWVPDNINYFSHVIPQRVKACQTAIVTLILVHRNDSRQTSFGQIDVHNLLYTCQLLWQSRRLPVWDSQNDRIRSI